MSDSDQRATHTNKWTMSMEAIKVDLKRAVAGGVAAGIVILVGGWLVGHVSGWKGFQLFKAALPSTRAFCGTLSLALGNILALMLTLLSLSASMEVNIKWSHYQRVRQISWLVTVTLIVTIICYLLMNIPVAETEKGQMEWFMYVYYALLVVSSLLGGSFITIVLLLFNTVRDMIEILHPKNEGWLQEQEKNEN